jgi:hypothetical protein
MAGKDFSYEEVIKDMNILLKFQIPFPAVTICHEVGLSSEQIRVSDVYSREFSFDQLNHTE